MRRVRRRRSASLAVALALATGPARAVEPGEMLADPALEGRARKISAELRCLVCQNQSIDDSNAPLAKDLRVLVREQIKAGRSDSEVMSFVVERYGAFVLLRPRLGPSTLVLWLTPLLVLGAAGYALVRLRRQTATQTADAPLTEDERRRLESLLKSD